MTFKLFNIICVKEVLEYMSDCQPKQGGKLSNCSLSPIQLPDLWYLNASFSMIYNHNQLQRLQSQAFRTQYSVCSTHHSICSIKKAVLCTQYSECSTGYLGFSMQHLVFTNFKYLLYTTVFSNSYLLYNTHNSVIHI